jgi:hypothetical protein
MITDDANVIKAVTQATATAAAEHHPVGAMRERIAAGTGTVTRKVRVGNLSGTSTATLWADVDGPAWIQAVEV